MGKKKSRDILDSLLDHMAEGFDELLDEFEDTMRRAAREQQKEQQKRSKRLGEAHQPQSPMEPSVEDFPPTAYDVLGLTPYAEDIVVVAAFRALSKKYHTDNGSEPNEDRMKLISNAYNLLKRDRKAYNKKIGFVPE